MPPTPLHRTPSSSWISSLSLASYNTDPPTAWLPYTGEPEIRGDLNACQTLFLHLSNPAADSGKQLLNCRFLQAFQNYADSAQEFQTKKCEMEHSHLKLCVLIVNKGQQHI